MSKVLVIGAGAAGSMAAIFAARAGNDVLVFEKNAKTGKKILQVRGVVILLML